MPRRILSISVIDAGSPRRAPPCLTDSYFAHHRAPPLSTVIFLLESCLTICCIQHKSPSSSQSLAPSTAASPRRRQAWLMDGHLDTSSPDFSSLSAHVLALRYPTRPWLPVVALVSNHDLPPGDLYCLAGFVRVYIAPGTTNGRKLCSQDFETLPTNNITIHLHRLRTRCAPSNVKNTWTSQRPLITIYSV